MKPSTQNSQRSAHSPIRVLHVLYELRPSGTEAMLRAAAPYFRAENIDGEILAISPRAVGAYAQELSDAGYAIHYLPFTRNLSFFRKYRRLVRTGRYDVVHIHTEAASTWLAASILLLARAVRSIGSSFSFTGSLRFRRRLTRLLSRMIGVRQLAVSPSVQKNEWLRFANRTEVCLNWYDSDRIVPPSDGDRRAARAGYGLLPDQFAIVSVGNCAPVKNHGVVIEALSRLRNRSNIVYLHAGQEDEQKNEQRLARALGVEGMVRFLGAISDVRPLLWAADCFVMPSLYEGLGNAAIEALGSGTPVLLADAPGMRDFREWFRNIPLCLPNAEAFADALGQLSGLPSPASRASSGPYAATARSTFGIDEGCARYIAIYRQEAGAMDRP